MNTDNADFESLKTEYNKQWEWFRRNSFGNCFEPRGKCDEDESMRQEFERRHPEFLALVQQMEAMPLPYYFCWAEAVFDEDNDEIFRLNPDTLICVQVDGITKKEAKNILGASVYDLRDELIDFGPDNDRVLGNSRALPVSELDFILLHRYAGSGFFSKTFSELFPSPEISPGHWYTKKVVVIKCCYHTSCNGIATHFIDERPNTVYHEKSRISSRSRQKIHRRTV